MLFKGNNHNYYNKKQTTQHPNKQTYNNPTNKQTNKQTPQHPNNPMNKQTNKHPNKHNQKTMTNRKKKNTCHLDTLEMIKQVSIETLKWFQSKGIFNTGWQITPDPREWMNGSVFKA